MTVFIYVATLMLFAAIPAWIRAEDAIEYCVIFVSIFGICCLGTLIFMCAWKWVFG